MAGVTCAITGQQYDTIAAAAKHHNLSTPTVTKSIRTGQPVYSKTLDTHTWFVTDITPELLPIGDNRTVRVLCVTTGQEYDSMGDAADQHNLHLTALSRAIRTGKAVRGLVWSKIKT